MCLLGIGSDDRGEGGAKLVELRLCCGVEEGELGDIDSIGGVLGVESNSGSRLCPGTTSTGTDTDITEQISGVVQIGCLLGLAESLAALRLGLLVITLLFGRLLLSSTVGLVLSDTLTLWLLSSGGGGSCLGLRLGSLLFLLTFGLGVFGRVPGV